MPIPLAPTHLKSVLIVEDDPVCAALYKHCLQDLVPQLQIIEASDGYDALGKLAHFKPDLMILDLQMPSFDGLELLSLIAAKAAYSDLPVIVVSSTPAPASEIVKDLPNAHVFLKPLRPALLQKVIGELLRMSPERGPLTAGAYAGDERRLARNIAAQFYELMPERLAQLEHYISHNDTLQLHAWCHAMIGTASVIGASVLLERLRALQSALDRDDRSHYPTACEQITREVRQFAVALDKAFDLSATDYER